MKHFSITLDLAPVPKGRPRMTRKGHTYTPARTRNWESAATLLIRAASRRYSMLHLTLKYGRTIAG